MVKLIGEKTLEEWEKMIEIHHRDKTTKEKFYEYIEENFSMNTDSMNLIGNIIAWVWLQSFDKEDTVNILSALLDGIGITSSEIEQFINW